MGKAGWRCGILVLAASTAGSYGSAEVTTSARGTTQSCARSSRLPNASFARCQACWGWAHTMEPACVTAAFGPVWVNTSYTGAVFCGADITEPP